MRVFLGQGRFVLKRCAKFYFMDGQSVPENGDVLSQICQGCFVQGLLCPKDRFVTWMFHYKISGTKNPYDVSFGEVLSGYQFYYIKGLP
jgi:hypothetical protein